MVETAQGGATEPAVADAVVRINKRQRQQNRQNKINSKALRIDQTADGCDTAAAPDTRRTGTRHRRQVQISEEEYFMGSPQ